MKTTLIAAVAAATFATLSVKADFNCTNNWGTGTNLWGSHTNDWSSRTNDWCDRDREDFRQTISLAATTNAPDGSFGTATLRAESDDGTNTGRVKITLVGLAAGTYNVSATDFTGTNNFDLGTVDVTTNSLFAFRNGDDDEDEQDGDSDHRDDGDFNNCRGTNTITFTIGRGAFELPSGLDPTNVAYLFIFDTNGVVYFTGDFTSQTNVSAVYYCKTVPVLCPGSDSSHGKGTLTLFYKKGKISGKFALNAAGLPPRQSLGLKANGQSCGSTSSNAKGTVTIKSLQHAKLMELQTVEARDKKGNLVFSAHF